MTSQGLAPVPLVPIPRVGPVRVARGLVVRVLTTLARLGLLVLVAVSTAAATAVATGHSAIPLQALAAVRVAEAFPTAPPAAASVRSVAAPPTLRVSATMNLPLGS